MSAIRSHIKSKMEEKGISAHALEKMAGLRQSAVQNILYGRSKNPSIQILQAIAHALDCTVSDLIAEEESFIRTQTSASTTSSKTSNAPWNCKLYIDCLGVVYRLLNKQEPVELNKELILDYVDEVYLYSLKSESNLADKNFAEWLLNRRYFATTS